MTTVEQMSGLVNHIATRVAKLCVHSTDYPNIDEWDAFADEFDIHYDNQDDINVLEVVAYGLRRVGDGPRETDTDTMFFKASYNIRETKEANMPITNTSTSHERISVMTNRNITDDNIEDIAEIIGNRLRNDERFAAHIHSIFVDRLYDVLPDRVDAAVSNVVAQVEQRLSREELAHAVMDDMNMMNSNFMRGLMDTPRFRTMVDSLVQTNVNSLFNVNDSWISDLIENAIAERTRNMVNETVERSLKLIAHRISAGNDV